MMKVTSSNLLTLFKELDRVADPSNPATVSSPTDAGSVLTSKTRFDAIAAEVSDLLLRLRVDPKVLQENLGKNLVTLSSEERCSAITKLVVAAHDSLRELSGEIRRLAKSRDKEQVVEELTQRFDRKTVEDAMESTVLSGIRSGEKSAVEEARRLKKKLGLAIPREEVEVAERQGWEAALRYVDREEGLAYVQELVEEGKVERQAMLSWLGTRYRMNVEHDGSNDVISGFMKKEGLELADLGITADDIAEARTRRLLMETTLPKDHAALKAILESLTAKTDLNELLLDSEIENWARWAFHEYSGRHPALARMVAEAFPRVAQVGSGPGSARSLPPP